MVTRITQSTKAKWLDTQPNQKCFHFTCKSQYMYIEKWMYLETMNGYHPPPSMSVKSGKSIMDNKSSVNSSLKKHLKLPISLSSIPDQISIFIPISHIASFHSNITYCKITCNWFVCFQIWICVYSHLQYVLFE